jgi:hypothetical protein
MTLCSFVRYDQVQNPCITPLLHVQLELSTPSSLAKSVAIKEPVKPIVTTAICLLYLLS